jgi:hypothetical protein
VSFCGTSTFLVLSRTSPNPGRIVFVIAMSARLLHKDSLTPFVALIETPPPPPPPMGFHVGSFHKEGIFTNPMIYGCQGAADSSAQRPVAPQCYSPPVQ